LHRITFKEVSIFSYQFVSAPINAFLQLPKVDVCVDESCLCDRLGVSGDGPFLNGEGHGRQLRDKLGVQHRAQRHPPLVQLLHPLVQLLSLRVSAIQQNLTQI